MNQVEKDQLKMYCNSIANYDTFEDLKQYILNKENGSNVFEAIKIDLEEYFNKYGRKPKYWMLITNTSKWNSGYNQFEVNDNLLNLDLESWRINKKTDMELQMKKGDLGIIKVSEDGRSKINRTTDNGEVMPILNAGIYSIFEIVEDEDGEVTRKSTDGDFYVNIKVINNLFANDKNISKENSIKLLGENLYKSIPSTKIDKSIFDKVIKYIENEK
jgi:hypothetical protein